MIVKNVYYLPSMSTKIAVEMPDGSFYTANLSPFRPLTASDLTPVVASSEDMGKEIPENLLKRLQIGKTSYNRLKQLRMEAGMTQLQLASKSGVYARQIQRIESGESEMSNVTLGNAAAIARTLGVSIESLLE